MSAFPPLREKCSKSYTDWRDRNERRRRWWWWWWCLNCFLRRLDSQIDKSSKQRDARDAHDWLHLSFLISKEPRVFLLQDLLCLLLSLLRVQWCIDLVAFEGIPVVIIVIVIIYASVEDSGGDDDATPSLSLLTRILLRWSHSSLSLGKTCTTVCNWIRAGSFLLSMSCRETFLSRNVRSLVLNWCSFSLEVAGHEGWCDASSSLISFRLLYHYLFLPFLPFHRFCLAFSLSLLLTKDCRTW